MHKGSYILFSWEGYFTQVLSGIVFTDLYSLGAMATRHRDIIKGRLNMMNCHLLGFVDKDPLHE